MNRSLVKVEVNDLKLGMYVSQLDRPWLDTPFLFQGFVVRNTRELEQLSAHCQHVFIDVERDTREDAKHPLARPRKIGINLNDTIKRVDADGHYQNAHTVEKEMLHARQARAELNVICDDIAKSVRTEHAINSAMVHKAVSSMVDSVVRNPDAMIWLTQLRERRSLLYQHAVNCAVWMVAFGRSLGLERSSLRDLGLIGLLFDVGKSKLPPGLVTRTPPLSPEDNALLRTHVDHGAKLLKNTKGISQRVLTAILTHHERHDGSGFPNCLSGSSIPVYGRMAGIVDWFQSRVRPYDGRKPQAAVDIVGELQGQRNKLFQPELVDQFVKVAGVYPTGTLVELSTGEVGAVIAQNHNRNLEPVVMIVTNTSKKRLKVFDRLDLSAQSQHRINAGKEIQIVKSCPVGAYGIDPATLDVNVRSRRLFGIRTPFSRA